MRRSKRAPGRGSVDTEKSSSAPVWGQGSFGKTLWSGWFPCIGTRRRERFMEKEVVPFSEARESATLPSVFSKIFLKRIAW